MDDSSLWITAGKLLAVIVLVLANGFFVAAEFSLVGVRRSRVQQLVEQGHPLASAVQLATQRLDAYLAATQLGITMASIALGWIGEPALAHLVEPLFQHLPERWTVISPHSLAVAIAFSIITALHIVLGELAPKSLALQRTEGTALATARPLELFLTLFRPAIFTLNNLGNLVLRVFGLQPAGGEQLVHSPEELKLLVGQSARAGLLEPEQQEMLERVFEFSQLTAHQIMVPRTEMVAIPVDITLPDLFDIIEQTRHSRLPVYEETIDNIIGILYVKDLLLWLEDHPRGAFNVRELMRPALSLPETLHANDVFAAMRAQRVHIAIVVDEFGGTAGMVTMEDLMERVFGELQGELERQQPADIVRLPNGQAIVNGLLLIDDFNDEFGVRIDDPDYDTIGGHVFGRLGRRPRLGDEVAVDGYRLRVIELDGLRIARLRVTPVAHAGSGPDSAEGTAGR